MDWISELISLVPRLKAGEMAAVGTLVMLSVRAYRALGAPWPTGRKKWLAQVAIFCVSLVASLLVGALVGGVAWPVAIVEAFAIGATAIASHEGTRAIGHAVRSPEPPASRRSPFGSAASLVFPRPPAERVIEKREFDELKRRESPPDAG